MRISNPPTAEALMEGARSIGNYDLAAALGDLIDNSITAEANTISLTCIYNAKNPIITINIPTIVNHLDPCFSINRVNKFPNL